MARTFRRLLVWAAIAVAALFAVFLALVSLGIRVELDRFRPVFEAAATAAIARPLSIEGSVVLVPSFSPTLEIHGLRVANPEGWPGSGDFAHMELARLRLAVLPLLWRKIVVAELTAEGVTLALEQDATGRANWIFGEAEEEEQQQLQEADDFELADLFVTQAEIESLAMRRVDITFGDARSGQHFVFAADELEGFLSTHGTLRLRMNGRISKEPYTLSLSGGSPADLFSGAADWPFDVEVEIAGTSLRVETMIDAGGAAASGRGSVAGAEDEEPLRPAPQSPQRLGEVAISLSGERLDSLDGLLGIGLPPLGPHRFDGSFRAFAERYEAEIRLGVGSSELSGTMSLAIDASPPRAEITLSAPSVQLDDFELGEWSPFGPEIPEDEPASAADAASDPPPVPAEYQALLSPEVLNRFAGRIEIAVDTVVSGRDELGSGRLVAELGGGRFALSPLQLELPGGVLEVDLSVTSSKGDLFVEGGIEVSRFDYGIIARRADPETDMRGLLGLSVELQSRATDPTLLSHHMSGHIDFAVFPEEFEAGIIDLWAVNLLSSVLPMVDSGENSTVNCVVGLFDVADGQLTARTLLADTTRMSVVGQARVSFPEEHVEVELAPAPKEPQFFNLATPIVVDGSFEDFGLRVKPEDLVGTVIRFVTSIVHVPVQQLIRLFEPDRPDACIAAVEGRDAIRAGEK